jgi:hypothetical protein
MKILSEILTPVSILILSGVMVFDRLVPRHVAVPEPLPVAAVNGVALGRDYAPILVSTYGDAWLAAARALEEGKPVAEAQKTLQDAWKQARVRAFADHVAPRFTLVLPEGAEPSTPQERARVVQLWRDFARGLNKGR